MRNRKYRITVLMAMAVLVSTIGVLTLRDTSVVKAAASFLATVAHDTTLAGDGTTTVPLRVANNGVGTPQLSNGAVTAPKIATGQVVRSLSGLTDDVILGAGSNISITQSGNTLTIASMLGLTSVAHDSALVGDGTGNSPLGIANLGVGTNQLGNSAITAQKIASGQVVTSLNNLRDDVTLAAGSNITIIPNGNTLTIASNTAQQPYINPLRVATLQWYGANKTGAGLSVGQAVALVCDGANMWVTVGDSLVKFRPSDLTILGTFSTQAGGAGGPLAFDGAYIWVGISDNPVILKFRASDGAVMGMFSLPGISQHLVFDGEHIWIATGDKLLSLRPSDGVITESVNLGSQIQGIAIAEGGWIWVTLSNNTVRRVLPGEDVTFGPYSVGIDPRGIAFDGANMWVANAGNTFITKLRGSDGAFLGNFNVSVNIGNPSRIAFDGSKMWFTTTAGQVDRIRISDGFGGGNNSTVGTNLGGIAFDGANMWIAHSSGVTKL